MSDEKEIHHRAHRDHREKYFCSGAQGFQTYRSLFVGPQLLPASVLRVLCDLCGEKLLPQSTQRPQRKALLLWRAGITSLPFLVCWPQSLRASSLLRVLRDLCGEKLLPQSSQRPQRKEELEIRN
jgi:hypothetical protein